MDGLEADGVARRAPGRSDRSVFIGLVLMLAMVTLVIQPAEAGANGPPPSGALGIRLVQDGSSHTEDPRGVMYIVEGVAPATTVERQVEVSNTTTSTQRVSVYVAAATLTDESFQASADHTANTLTSWTTVSPELIDLDPGGTARASIAIAVPADAASGESHGVVWAEVRSGSNGSGLALVSRVGVRIYLTVGTGDAASPDFTVDPPTTSRASNGGRTVRATVHNTGGVALEVQGTVELSSASTSLTAGPLPVSLATTLRAGGTQSVSVNIDRGVPAGEWDAQVTLHAGQIERSSHATVDLLEPDPQPSANGDGTERILLGVGAAFFLVTIGLLGLRRRVQWRAGSGPTGFSE
ncbi:MAG: hypothetical protein QOE25_312 [Actinomycetota bacterium]|nr:hypothetical protein [Actinomycetota bacterium]